MILVIFIYFLLTLIANIYFTEATNRVNDLFENKLKNDFLIVFTNWNTNVKLVFLNSISDRIKEVTDDIYVFLRDNLKMHGRYNSEVKNLWYQLSLNLKKEDVIQYVEEFLSQIGRMKYIRPIYKAYGLLNKKFALACFEKNK
jgi:hypothetical protein